MTKRRIIFFAIFGVYHFLLLFFTFYMESQKENFRFLGAMLKNFSLFKYGALLGVLLLIIDVIWSWRVNIAQRKENDALILEANTLKAKVYDLQEEAKNRGTAPTT
jgi:predicted ABC-type exoprotein transport system permease subunit